ncbi:MAG: type II toxin-antitoxin system VapC family toxin [Deltaproteobacteria bacterium]|nr:type II toxin-antitoxin system VapC family toxin [Deltaproteobacteria bacterium]MBW1959291.1 type II toxin-antitoxin system VapC family toxin [Deltaproteobacteria bacterium]MBW2013375.1 type II toxin-antitoxin system VapC family toxin [Deltaproteobacteria bacterium]MBW2087444.1 type II toxin-antitoxin system VapC family toxin [Deltaproteobacteria bacterium]MBW2321755.1 type II toxin-antitoxin system VapC family toxin [Deltaproteobacteria bacterium]
MIAVDTNLLVRLLTKDDLRQAKRAAKIIERDVIFIPKTVVLETEWVLRHAYGIDKGPIMKGFEKMMGLPNVRVEDQQTVFQAISWYGLGLDFADALHLASSMKADKFVTFDNAFIKKARKLISIDITLP